MKTKSLTVIVMFVAMAAYSQQPSATAIKYNKSLQPALKIDLPTSMENMEAIILNKLKQTGYSPETTGALFWKENKVNGFYEYNSVVLPLPNTRKLDLYFKPVNNNKEETNKSTLYMLVSTGNENFSSPEGDSTIWNSSVSFLQSFVESTAAYSLSQDINGQQKIVSNSRDKLEKLTTDRKDMEAKMKKLEDDMRTNKSSMESQQVEIDYQVRALDSLKAKIK